MLVVAICFTSKWKRRCLDTVDISEMEQCYCVQAEWACLRAINGVFSYAVRRSKV